MTDRRLAISAWESLFRAQHEILREISGDFGEDELTQAEYDVLLTVVRGDDNSARLRDVTANMLISQPSVSRLVDRMVARDLISKCVDPLDGRGAIVRATERARPRSAPRPCTVDRSPSGCRCSATTSWHSCSS
jgi:DNA-binding MarR family transcriptional regulator